MAATGEHWTQKIVTTAMDRQTAADAVTTATVTTTTAFFCLPASSSIEIANYVSCSSSSFAPEVLGVCFILA